MPCARPPSTPSSEPDYQARVRLTGSVPIADEEFATVKEGMVLHGIGTVFVVLFILWLALKSGRIILAVFLALAGGLAITAALGFLMVGSLNMISVAFFVLFVGLGVDFCIQYSVRYRDERYHKDNLKTALVDAGRDIGAPLALAAAATAAGFLAFLPTNYQGVSELGLIAGVGMFVAFLMSITVLPALLAVLDPPGEKEPLGFASFAVGRQLRRAQPKVGRRWNARHRHYRAAAAVFPALRLQSDQSAQPDGRIDRDLSRPAPGSQHRRERDQRPDRFGEGRRGSGRASWRSCPKSSASCRSNSFVPGRSGDQARTDQASLRRLWLPRWTPKPNPAPTPREAAEILTQTAAMLDPAAQQPGARRSRRQASRRAIAQACGCARRGAQCRRAGRHRAAQFQAGTDENVAAGRSRHRRQPAGGPERCVDYV